MVKYKNILLGVLLAGTIVACERPTPPTSARAADSQNFTIYLQQQIQRLQTAKPMVLKSVKTENSPTETVETSDVDWEDELAIFQEVDLSRPALQDLYSEQREPQTNGSTSVMFKKVEEAETPVQYLQLLLSPDNNIQQLEALVLEKNLLFYSRRKISLSTHPRSGDISSYRIEGVQKLIFGDSLHYRIDANL